MRLDSEEHLTRILDLEHGNSKHAVNGARDLFVRKVVDAFENPHQSGNGYQADESWIVRGEIALQYLGGLTKLPGIIPG
jgi:hypothetical protein